MDECKKREINDILEQGMALIDLRETCMACPEQYDAYLGDRKVAYLRLRHGYFSVEFLESGGELLFEAHPEGDGMFEEEEREEYLNKAKRAIFFRLMKEIVEKREKKETRVN